MADLDLTIEGGTVVTAGGRARLNVHVRDGRVVALDPGRARAAETGEPLGARRGRFVPGAAHAGRDR